jgi:hypothetical protein
MLAFMKSLEHLSYIEKISNGCLSEDQVSHIESTIAEISYVGFYPQYYTSLGDEH